MKLIDVDALINEIKKETEKAIEQDDKVGSFWLGYFAGLVIKQPTIQPEERTEKHTETHACDLISRQAAIDAIENSSKPYVWQGAEIVRNLPPAQSEPQWIPVSERLPEDGKYIVTVHGYGWNGTMFTSVSIAECISKRWVGNNGVIAWMPLPEPYQKGAKD